MPKAIEYHNKCKALRAIILPHRQEIIDAMVLGNYHIQFHFAMAESWSNKKKQEMEFNLCNKSQIQTIYSRRL